MFLCIIIAYLPYIFPASIADSNFPNIISLEFAIISDRHGSVKVFCLQTPWNPVLFFAFLIGTIFEGISYRRRVGEIQTQFILMLRPLNFKYYKHSPQTLNCPMRMHLKVCELFSDASHLELYAAN